MAGRAGGHQRLEIAAGGASRSAMVVAAAAMGAEGRLVATCDGVNRGQRLRGHAALAGGSHDGGAKCGELVHGIRRYSARGKEGKKKEEKKYKRKENRK